MRKRALGIARRNEDYRRKLERAMRFELTTPTLARLCSTPELRPHIQVPRAQAGAAAGKG